MRFLAAIVFTLLTFAMPIGAAPPNPAPPRFLRPNPLPPFERRRDNERQARVQTASLARLFLGGPTVFLLFTGLLAVIGVTAAGAGRAERLVRFGVRAADRLEGRRFVCTLWGIAAAVLAASLFLALMATKVLAGLGLLVGLVFFLLTALGLGVTAAALGRGLRAGFDGAILDDAAALHLGLWALLLATLVPVVGWIVAAVAAASGLGATLDALLTRRE